LLQDEVTYPHLPGYCVYKQSMRLKAHAKFKVEPSCALWLRSEGARGLGLMVAMRSVLRNSNLDSHRVSYGYRDEVVSAEQLVVTAARM
jgi:hypothetical protein